MISDGYLKTAFLFIAVYNEARKTAESERGSDEHCFFFHLGVSNTLRPTNITTYLHETTKLLTAKFFTVFAIIECLKRDSGEDTFENATFRGRIRVHTA